MTTTFVTTNQTTTQTISNNDEFFLTAGTSINTTGDGIAASDSDLSNVTLFIDGTINANYGVDFFFSPVDTTSQVRISVGATGAINAMTDGIILDDAQASTIFN